MIENQLQKWLLITLSATLPWGGVLLFTSASLSQAPSQLQERLAQPSSSSRREVGYQETPYTLGPGDGVAMEVFNVPEYSGTYQVSIQGTLNLPIVGSVDVQGLTIPEANNLIQKRYAPILQRPIVNLRLAQRRTIRVAIAGEVNRPGSYNLGGEGAQFPPITEAIRQAGGITRSADARQVKLRRVVDGEQQVLNVNLWELVQEGDIVQDVTLRDGDSIFVPTAEENVSRETRQLSRSTIAPATESVEVAVVGEVSRPGPHTVGGGDSGAPPTVTQAIQTAGGITNLSDIRNVEVRRETRTGEQKVLNSNLWQLLQQGEVKEDIILQPGDTVVVPKAEEIEPDEAEALASASFSPETISVNIIGEANRTGRIELPSNTPLSQALLAAGGFNRQRADEGEVELVRLKPDGTVTRREIAVDFDQGIDPETNPTLRNNDVIVVERSTLTKVSDTVSTVLQPITSVVQGIRFFDIFFGNN